MSLPILTTDQMRAWEKASWDSGLNEFDVIQTVGRKLARRLLRETRRSDRILVLAGKGHNGDDAAALHAQLRHRRQTSLLRIRDPVKSLAELEEAIARKPDWIVEGLFGIGLSRPLSKEWIELIQRINESGVPVYSIDVPSGLNAETGEPQPVCVQAHATLTLGAPKHGLVQPSAWDWVGRLCVEEDIGLAPCKETSGLQWTSADDFRRYPPPRRMNTHKGTYGHLAIIAGSRGFHGAAILAAQSAARAQPGLITLYVPEAIYHPVAAQLASTMVSPCTQLDFDESRHSAFLIGPGLADPNLPGEWRQWVRGCWVETDKPMVVDASALDWLPGGAVKAKAARIVTPHPGEAARLLGIETADVQGDRPKALKELSAKFGNCWVALKGHQTLTGNKKSEVYYNSSGNPHMAQGGSGDVLSGWLGGLMAQPELSADPLRCLRYAVWEHGLAADRLQAKRRGWTIEDLIGELGV